MTRDDSGLYTGASSAAFASPAEQEVKDKVDLRKQDKLDKQNRLKPVADDVLAEIQKDIDELSDIRFAHIKELVASGIPNALEIDMLSTEKTIDKLNNLKVRLSNVLRERS